MSFLVLHLIYAIDICDVSCVSLGENKDLASALHIALTFV